MANYDDTATVSGSVVGFSNGADSVPLKNWLVTLPASLDGYSEVNGVKIASNNLMSFPEVDFTYKNVRYYTVDGILYLDGTSTGEISSAANEFKALSFFLKAGTYYFNRGALALPSYIYKKSDGTQLRVNNGSFTLAEDTECNFGFYIYNKTFSNSKADLCLNIGSTAITYEDTAVQTQYTAQLGRTIYGGTADIVTGEGEDENGNAFTFTPITPTPETALGTNNFWSDQGNTELTYYKDGYGFTSVTVHKETPDGEPIEETRKLHRIIYEGQVDVINGTGLIYRGESGTQYDPPEQISFTPIEVSTDGGENTLYADEGDSAITYRKAVD